jgi:ubiquitin-protein ligase
MSPRLKRLQLDFDTLRVRFANWPVIQITNYQGNPPESYQFTYNVKGLYVATGGEILERNVHVLEVSLSLGYPRRAPQCKMLTPVFHPNFDETSVCIGDFWAASEGLEDLVIRIGRMLTYQEYNTKSPLNGVAAAWSAQNTHLLPVDNREVAPPGAFRASTPPGGAELGRESKNAGGVQEPGDAWSNPIVVNFAESDAGPLNDKSSVLLSPGLKLEEIKVTCPCGQSLLIERSLFGTPFSCPSCKRRHLVS